MKAIVSSVIKGVGVCHPAVFMYIDWPSTLVSDTHPHREEKQNYVYFVAIMFYLDVGHYFHETCTWHSTARFAKYIIPT